MKDCQVKCVTAQYYKAQPIFRFTWPLVLTIFQSLIQQQEAGLVPEQCFDAIFASATEQKQRWLMRIHLEMGRHDTGKAVDGLAHVRVPAGQVDIYGRQRSHELVQRTRNNWTRSTQDEFSAARRRNEA